MSQPRIRTVRCLHVPTPLEAAKQRFTIFEVADKLGLHVRLGSCRSPFRDDRNPSFSVFDGGRRWRDFATGQRGDVVDFLAKARGSSTADAARELLRMAGTQGTGSVWKVAPGVKQRFPEVRMRSASPSRVPPMVPECQQIWDEGVAHLLDHERWQQQIENWRCWPSGTVRVLADAHLIAAPRLRGARGVAFPVQMPVGEVVELLATTNVGFHYRWRPRPQNAHSMWSYLPNEKSHGIRIPALPFVVGEGTIHRARTIVVTEGQWDAITLAAAAGWLAHDTAWPEHIALFGIRGAPNWRQFVNSWGKFWPASVKFVVFADADDAGNMWLSTGGFVAELVTRGHDVRVIRSARSDAKDLNDLHRSSHLTRKQIEEWLYF